MKTLHGTIYGDFAGHPIELWSDERGFYLVDPQEPAHDIRIAAESFQQRAQALAAKFADGWKDSPTKATFYITRDYAERDVLP